VLFFDYAFLFLLLPITILLHVRLPPRLRNAWLLIVSLLFYAASSLVFLPILFLSIAVDYVAGAQIAKTESLARRRVWLGASLAANLGLLGYFKYAGFLTETAQGLGLAVPLVRAALPAGISFYTFQSMSYTIDVYRRDVARSRSAVDFAAFVTLFPQLIAGPIVRYAEVERALGDRTVTEDRAASGLFLLIVGLAKKLLVADTLAGLADPIFRGDPGFADGWAAMILYSGQIYFDFSAYSDMAIGLGRLLGFEFPRNFDSPYKATSFRDFWRRWHITLSAWLRDYLYVSIGGNRGGLLTTCRNLMITMLLGGLWHGASWNFVLWGGLHGLYLAAERVLGERNPLLSLPLLGRRAVVFVLVLLAWVPFKLPDLPSTISWWGAMLLGWGGLGAIDGVTAAGALACLFLLFVPPNSGEWRIDLRWSQVALASALLVGSLFVGYGRVAPSPFLYFRF
jgi:alginate O-acetyltransferase complex protein AlgI